MKLCSNCSKKLRSDYKLDICQKCLSVCNCGNDKDWRAKKCRSCCSLELSKNQWKRENVRQKMLLAMKAAGVIRRRKFEDLKQESFRNKKDDGRRYAYYWDNQGKRRAIYVYQWLWIQNVGKIPKGYVIHHKDGNHLNNALSNLELLTQKEHLTKHNLEKPKSEKQTGRLRPPALGSEVVRV